MSYAKNATLLSTLWALLSFGAYSQDISDDAYKIGDGWASFDTARIHPQPAEGISKFRTLRAIVPDSGHTGNMKIRRAVFDSEDTTAMHPQPSDGMDTTFRCVPPHAIKGWLTGVSVDTIPEPSTRIPDAHLRAAVKLIEHLRLDSLMLARDVRLWETKFGSASNTINLLNQRIETYKLLVANYEKSGGNTDKQLANDAALVKSMRAAIKREKTKTVLGVSLTAILAGLTIYLTHK